MTYREPPQRIVGKRRTSRPAAVVSGLCGIAAAVGLGVYVARIGIDVTEFSPGSVPSELWTLLAIRGVAAVLLLLPAAVAVGRGVVATWVLAAAAVLNVGLLLLERDWSSTTSSACTSTCCCHWTTSTPPNC